MRHVRVLLAVLASAALLAACGPINTPPQPDSPPVGVPAAQTITFFARALDGNGQDIYTQNIGYLVSAWDVELRPVIFSDGNATVEVVSTFTTAYFSFDPVPEIDRMTFTVSAAVPRGVTLLCEVRAGDDTQGAAQIAAGTPPISSDRAVSEPVGPLPIAYLNVNCAYPAL